MQTIVIPILRLPHAPENLPEYKTPGSVGMDLQAAISQPIELMPLARTLVPTGLIIELPENFEAQIRARSGLAIRYGITVINGVGTIDWDYRDEIKVGLVNLSDTVFTIQPGDRIAQMIIAPVTRAEWVLETDERLVDEMGRGGGFGSTGR